MFRLRGRHKSFLSLPPRDITDASNALNQDLLQISRWCCKNSLLINPDKTKLLVIGVPQLMRNFPRLSITILGKEIEPVSVARDLGVYIAIPDCQLQQTYIKVIPFRKSPRHYLPFNFSSGILVKEDKYT